MIIEGVFENGIFTPNNPVDDIYGRIKAKLFIDTYCELKKWEREKRILESKDRVFDAEQGRILAECADPTDIEIETLR
jgi:predicted DNA-binding antitoxin AbrB/MazE fold protein